MSDATQTNTSPDQPATMGQVKAAIRRKLRRHPEHEHTDLNIYPMMDMMTILLVFMIKTMASAASPLSLPVALPPSSTPIGEPEEAVTVTIAKSAILVEGEPIVAVKNGTMVNANPMSLGAPALRRARSTVIAIAATVIANARTPPATPRRR